MNYYNFYKFLIFPTVKDTGDRYGKKVTLRRVTHPIQYIKYIKNLP